MHWRRHGDGDDHREDLRAAVRSSPGGIGDGPILLEQNGSYYGPTLDLIFGLSGWTHFGLPGLVSNQFAKIAGSGPSTPDFSASAGAITLGFVTANTNSGGAQNLQLESGIDNWAVSLTPVPEPAVAAILALGALLLRRRS